MTESRREKEEGQELESSSVSLRMMPSSGLSRLSEVLFSTEEEDLLLLASPSLLTFHQSERLNASLVLDTIEPLR